MATTWVRSFPWTRGRPSADGRQLLWSPSRVARLNRTRFGLGSGAGLPRARQRVEGQPMATSITRRSSSTEPGAPPSPTTGSTSSRPRSEQVIGHVPAASTADIDAAVAAARRAFDEGEWPRLTPAERADYLTRMADAIAKRQEELAELITEELGCTLFLSQVYQVVSPVMSLNYNAEIGRSLDTVRGAAQRPRPAGGQLRGRQHHPDGRARAWSSRSRSASSPPSRPTTSRSRRCRRRSRPALIAGCTAVVKVTEPNPLATFIYGDICEEVGPAAGRHQHRRGPGAGGGVPRAPPGCRHGQLHRLGADRRSHRRRVRRADQAVRAGARREVGGDRPRRREARGRAAGAHRRQRRHERRPELRRADPSRRAGRAVRRVRRGARRGLPVPEDRRPDGGRHRHQPAGDRASARPRRGVRRARPQGGRHDRHWWSSAGRAWTAAGTSSPHWSPTPTTTCASAGRRSSGPWPR